MALRNLGPGLMPIGTPPPTSGQGGYWRGVSQERRNVRGPQNNGPSTAVGADPNVRVQPGTAPVPATGGTAPPLPGGGRPTPAPVADPTSPTGTESGAGILENWFNQRANGTDPGYEYSLKRGGDAIDTRMAAGGSFNSGARGQQQSDFAANMGAQREGQLDSLAAGAAGEHRGRLQDMFGIASNMAGGQAGLAGAYDITAANGMSASDNAILQMILGKAGVDSKADQGFLNNLFSLVSLGQGGGKTK